MSPKGYSRISRALQAFYGLLRNRCDERLDAWDRRSALLLRSRRFEPLQAAELLEARCVLSSSSLMPENIAAPLAALLAREFQADSSAADVATRALVTEDNDLIIRDADGRLLVDLWLKTEPTSILPALVDHGAIVHAVDLGYRLIEASVAGSAVAAIAALDGVLAITPIYLPITRAGVVQSQGDAVVQADVARSLGFTGAGTHVSVISDSAYSLGTSQASGDLPAIVDRYLEFYGSDEGRAMLEIVHDLAPGAALSFASGMYGELSFANAIRSLAAAGSQIIVDDLAYYAEPYFQDGIIAQAVNEVTSQYGVVYVSAAGNDATRSYEAVFNDNGSGYHDFDASAGSDVRQQITVPSGYGVVLTLQWDDPFYTTAGVTHNFDVRIYDAAGNEVSATVNDGLTNNLATQQPLEIVSWTGSGTGIYQVEIRRVAGSGDSQLKYILSTNSTVGTIDEYATNSGTVFGHAAAASAIAVGAVPYFDPSNLEAFSARGDVTIYFDAAGNRLASPEIRHKPDFVAPDNVNTTFFGTDIPQDADTYRNFAGTSAAAPHLAAVAALVLDANPNLTRDEVYAVLQSTAVDLGSAGRDVMFGLGRVDAASAVTAAQSVADVTPPKVTLLSPVSTHGWDVSSIVLQFSEPMNATTLSQADDYELVGAGTDNNFDTSDDATYAVTASYDSALRRISLSPSANLADGRYRLTVHGSTLSDPSGNTVIGGDSVFDLAVEPEGDIVSLQGMQDIDIRADGTIFAVYSHNPQLGNYKWPQIMIGQFDTGGFAVGPFRAVPTDMINSFRVESPAIAVNENGGVVVYSDYEEIIYGEPDGFAMAFQRIDEHGRPIGGRVIAGYAGDGRTPRVAMNPAGQFVLTYGGKEYNAVSGYYHWQVRARRFDATGNALGASFRVNGDADAEDPAVDISADGSSVFAWSYDDGIFARRYDSSGTAGAEFRVSAMTAGSPSTPDIKFTPDGGLIAVWTSTQGDDFLNPGVFVRRFDAAGNPIGSDVRISSGSASVPRLAVDADGRYVVVWRQSDGDGSGIYARRFNSDGTSFGETILVSQGQAGDQDGPRVAFGPDHQFFVAWSAPSASGRWLAWDADGSVPFGPQVLTGTPETAVQGPLSQITFTFDREIDASTVSTADVQLFDPVGRIVTPTGITTTDNRSFVLHLSPQAMPGIYRLVVGPSIQDTAGRLMGQDGDTINGETGDRFSRSVTVAPIPSSFPNSEGFEHPSIDELSRSWSFSTNGDGVVDLVAHAGPQGGVTSLRMYQSTGSYSGGEDATLTVDLSGQSGVTLDVWTKELMDSDGGATVSISSDGVKFSSIATIFGTSMANQWRRTSIDLDAAVAAAGLNYAADFKIRFTHDVGYYAGSSVLLWDDVRITTGVDVFGPRITNQTPTGSVNGPVESVAIVFNEEIDPTTFTAADVKVIGPAGGAVILAGDPIDAGDHRTFTIHFAAPQALAGTYSLEIGPNIFDVAGNMMNQNGDTLLGDEYVSTFEIASAVATVPLLEAFEVADVGSLAAHWSFATTLDGAVEISPQEAPQSGGKSLRMYQTTNDYGEESATLTVDLAGRANVTLDYWTNELVDSDGRFEVAISADGVTFVAIENQGAVVGKWRHWVVDLDAVAASANIAYSSTFRIQFRHINGYYSRSSQLLLDDVRVLAGADVFGPRVVGQTPAGSLGGSVNSFTVTFNEDIDAASFNASDVSVTGPTGQAILLAGDPVDGGDHRTFSISFAAPLSMAGVYRISIGPDVVDSAGNMMNQNADRLFGDGYTGTFEIISSSAATLPLIEPFEALSIADLASYWWFNTAAGAIDVTTAAGPYAGTLHLRMTNGNPGSHTIREAVLKLDLSSLASATDLVLDFWLQRQEITGSTSNYLRLLVSGDGATWRQLGTDLVPTRNVQTHYAFDLDQALAATTPISLDGDVYLKFLHNGYYNGSVVTLDNIRVRQATGLNSAPTLTTISTIAGGVEDTPLTIDFATLAAAANEADANGDELAFRIDAVLSGTLTKNGQTVLPGATFFAAGDVLEWTPTANANGSALAAFSVRAFDGDLVSGAAVVVNAAVAAANDAPILDTSGNPTLTSLTEDTVTGSTNTVGTVFSASISDVDPSALKGIAVVGVTGNGVWQYNVSGTWVAFPAVGENGALLLRSSDTIRFNPTANFNGTATIDYRAWDRTFGTQGTTVDLTPAGSLGGTSSFSLARETATLTVTPVNDAPTLDNGGTPSIAVVEDDSTGLGTAVTDIIASAGAGRIGDVDSSAMQGIAVFAVDTTRGSWQFSIDNGLNWSPFGTPSTGSARLLAAEAQTRVRFTPNANYHGSLASGLSFYAWDRTSGTNGGTASASSRGGTTAFSSASETVALVVTPVADTPSLSNASTQEDVQSSGGLVFARHAADGAEVTHFKVTDIVGGALYLADGATVVTAGSYLTVAQGAAGLRFTPSQDSTSPGSVTVRASTSADDGGLGGGVATAFISVNEVNDAPIGGADVLADSTEDGGQRTISFASLLGNDTLGGDEIGQTLAIVGLSNIVGGTAVLSGNNVLFDPAPDFFGSAGFTYTLRDDGTTGGAPDHKTATASVAFVIVSVNDAPQIDLNGTSAGTGFATTFTEDDAAAPIVDSFALTVNDVDDALLSGATVTLVNPADGVSEQLLVDTSGTTISGIYTNGVLTLSGAAQTADYERVLRTLTYRNASQRPDTTTRNITIEVRDGSALSSSAVSTVSLVGVNDSPTLSINAGLLGTEGETTVLDAAVLTVTDLDHSSSQIYFTVLATPGNGALVRSGTPLTVGAYFTQADVDSGIIAYAHDGGETTSDAVRLGAIDEAGSSIDDILVSIVVTPVNDVPTLDVNSALVVNEGATGPISVIHLRAADADNAAAELRYLVRSAPMHGRLRLFGTELDTGLEFTQAAVDSGGLSYLHDGGETTSDDFTFEITDGTDTTVELFFAIVVNAVNDAAVVDLNGNAPGTGFSVDFTEKSGPVAIVNIAELSLDDPDDVNLASARVTIANPLDGAAERLIVDTTGTNVTASYASGTLALVGVDSKEHYRRVLRSVAYVNDSLDPKTADRNVSFTVNDGLGDGPAATATVRVTAVNDPPVLFDRTFSLFDKAKAGTLAGTTAALNPETSESLAYAIVSGDDGAFAIDALGRLTVADPKKLGSIQRTLTVRATDGGQPPLSADAQIVVRLLKTDTPPAFSLTDAGGTSTSTLGNRATLFVIENSPAGTPIGTLSVADVDEPDVVLFANMTDRTGAFSFDPATGRITVADATKLDFEKTKKFTLVFKVFDHGIPGAPTPKSASLTVTVNVNDRNEAPIFTSVTTVGVAENNKPGAAILTVKAVDPDKTTPNKTLSYSIISQKDQNGDALAANLFAIDAKGKITVPTANALDYEQNKSYMLVVRAFDGGTPSLFTEQTITVNLHDVNDAPLMQLLDVTQNPVVALAIAENSVAGTLIGYIRVTNADRFAEVLSLKGTFAPSGSLAVGAVDQATGLAAITVADAGKLDFEKVRGGIIKLTVTATDSGFTNAAGKKLSKATSTATFTVQVIDVEGA